MLSFHLLILGGICMIKYILRRLLMMIPVLLGVSILIFLLVNSIPGDPASYALGADATQEQIDSFNESIGYYDPLPVRYVNYMKNLLRFDFGTSYVSKLAVLDELGAKVPISIIVAFTAILGSLLVGIPLGILSAVKQYSLLDIIPTSLAICLASAPSFWLGLLLMLEFSMKLQLLPSFGVEKPGWFILPMLTLVAIYGSNQMRLTRSSMLETIRQDYINTVRAKGATERVVIWRHALKNALLPVITAAGNNFGILLGGAIVTETLFSLPGLGTFIVNGVKQKDVPVVMGGTLTLAALFAFIMLAVDIIYAYADPRVKARYKKMK